MTPLDVDRFSTEVIGNAPTRVMLALLAVYERDGRATIRSVAAAVGRSHSTVHAHLFTLKRAGLIEWDRDHRGSLRPRVQVFACGTLSENRVDPAARQRPGSRPDPGRSDVPHHTNPPPERTR